MEFNQIKFNSEAIKIVAKENDKEVGRASLYFIKNDLHEEPYGLMEDVFVSEDVRGKGIGSKLIYMIIDEAKKHNCYKLVATSKKEKNKVHELYEKIGFVKMGVEFRIDL